MYAMILLIVGNDTENVTETLESYIFQRKMILTGEVVIYENMWCIITGIKSSI